VPLLQAGQVGREGGAVKLDVREPLKNWSCEGYGFCVCTMVAEGYSARYGGSKETGKL